MKLERKKAFIAKVIGVGKGRVVLNRNRLGDIKEAMTRQDILDLLNDGAIFVRDIKGRKAIEKRTTRRRKGSIRLPVKNSKRKYIILTRKLRGYIAELRKAENLSEERYQQLRREIRASMFKSKSHLKERIKLLK